MRTFRLGGAAVLSAGTLVDAVLDPLVDARNGLPAVVPVPQPAQTGAPPISGPVGGTGLLPFLTMGVAPGATLPAGALTGTWSGGTTTTPGSTATYTFVGVGAQLVLASNPAAGGIAWLTLDGAPRLAMDTAIMANPVTQTLLTPLGGTHSVQVAYYGDIAAGVQPLTAPVNAVGTSVAPLLVPVRLPRGGTTTATWTVAQVTDATHVSINGAGSYALGTTVSGVIPGVNLVLQSGTLTTGDRATFGTTATGVAILALNVATQEATDATWTSPIVSGDGTAVVPVPGSGQPTVYPLPLADPNLTDTQALQWLCLTWEEDPAHPLQAGRAATGNVLNAAAPAWASAAAATGLSPSLLSITHDGMGTGIMGLGVLPRGTYCQVQLAIPAYGYLRNPRLYAWQPDTDPDARRFPGVPGRLSGDDLAQRLYGGIAAAWALTERDPMRELLASCSVGGAVGALLDLHGAEWGLPRPFGLDDGVYAPLLRFLSAARGRGGTLGFYQQALALVLGPGVPFTVQPIVGGQQQWILGTSKLGIDTVLGSIVPGAWQVQLIFQVRSLRIPPQTLQQLIAAFVPVGIVPVYSWQ